MEGHPEVKKLREMLNKMTPFLLQDHPSLFRPRQLCHSNREEEGSPLQHHHKTVTMKMSPSFLHQVQWMKILWIQEIVEFVSDVLQTVTVFVTAVSNGGTAMNNCRKAVIDSIATPSKKFNDIIQSKVMPNKKFVFTPFIILNSF